MVFRSKIDAWLLLVLALASAPPFAFAVSALRAGQPWLPHAALGTGLVVVFTWLLWSTKYKVEANELVIYCGLFRWRIDARQVTRITPSRSPLSSPALSLDRLRIEYEGARKSILVSPADREAFLAAMQAARVAA